MPEQKRDRWDKVAIFIPIFTSLIVVGLGGLITACITQKYQEVQQAKDNNYKQIDLLVKLMPFLSSKDTLQNKVAIYAIRSLGYDSLASEIGFQINSAGTRYAIKHLSQDSSLPANERRIYMDKWERLKRMAPSSESKLDSSKYLINENGQVLMTSDGQPLIAQ